MVSDVCTFPVRLHVTDPDGRERVVDLRLGDPGPVTIGRAPENTLQIISPYISRRHAQAWPHDEGIVFEDLQSTSGSYRHGVRVGRLVLKPGESLHLGSPDGIRLAVAGLEEQRAVAAHTEILRISAPTDTSYLSSTGRISRVFDKDAASKLPQYKRVEARLRALIGLTAELLEVGDPDRLANLLLKHALEQLPVERGMVLFDGPDGLEPRVWTLQGSLSAPMRRPTLGPLGADSDPDGSTTADPDPRRPAAPFQPIGTVTRHVMEKGVGLLTLDATSDQRLEGSQSVVMQSISSIMCAPIVGTRKIHGVIYVDTHRALGKDNEDALDWLVAVAHQAGQVLDKIDMNDQQKRMLESMMRGLAASIDARDGMTAGHSARVAHYSVGTAAAMGMSVEDQYAIYYAALLHDYGKIGVDDAVLRKPSALTPEEYTHIQQHPKFTHDILSKIEFPEELADLPLMAASHHERWDGKGYPWGLQGDRIPLAGRIIAVADVYDSLTRKRHYRDPMPMHEVLEYLESGRGAHFDPEVLDGFFAYHESVLANREARRSQKRSRQAAMSPTTPGTPSDRLDDSIDLATTAGQPPAGLTDDFDDEPTRIGGPDHL